MIASRPLYDNLADSRLFVKPKAWEAVERAVERHLNIAMLGPRGSGKTSLLRHLQMVLRDGGAHVTFVDATAVEEARELAYRVRDARVGQPAPLAAGVSMAADAFRRMDAPLAGASRELAALLRDIGEAESAVMLVDASSSAQACFELFGRMRDVLWQQPHQWVLALDDTDRATALKPPADAFFDSLITLEPWAADELIELLGRRADANTPHELLTAAAAGAHGSPRDAVRALSDAVVHGWDPTDTLAAQAELEARASLLGRPAGMLMAELLQRRQASPSDEELQRTMGVSRARLSQLFSQLQDDGLVQVEAERAAGPGRPRTIYRPALPS